MGHNYQKQKETNINYVLAAISPASGVIVVVETYDYGTKSALDNATSPTMCFHVMFIMFYCFFALSLANK